MDRDGRERDRQDKMWAQGVNHPFKNGISSATLKVRQPWMKLTSRQESKVLRGAPFPQGERSHSKGNTGTGMGGRSPPGKG